MTEQTAQEAQEGSQPQCWAYGPFGRRCGLRAGHSGTHAVFWTDEECIDPAQAAAALARTAPPLVTYPIIEPANTPVPPPPGPTLINPAPGERFSGPVTLIQPTEPIPLSNEGSAGAPGACFACGCRAPHPCEKHDCRTFVA